MNTVTRTALTSAATARASKLCAEQLAFLAAGRTVFVKGKKTVVPFDADKRAQLKRLALAAFDATSGSTTAAVLSIVAPLVSDEGVTEETEEAFVAECLAVYSTAGVATVEAAYA